MMKAAALLLVLPAAALATLITYAVHPVAVVDDLGSAFEAIVWVLMWWILVGGWILDGLIGVLSSASTWTFEVWLAVLVWAAIPVVYGVQVARGEL